MPKPLAQQRIAKQRIAGRPIATAYGSVNLQAPYQFPPGSHTFTCPLTGYWKFVGWGNGGVGSAGGGASGSYTEITQFLRKGETVALVVARLVTGTSTTITLPNGRVATAGSAATSTPGVASGGDVNLNGSAGGASGANPGVAGLGTNGGRGGGTATGNAGGGGAPANSPFRGGDGGGFLDGNTQYAGSPGGGGFESIAANQTPGQGLVIASLVRE